MLAELVRHPRQRAQLVTAAMEELDRAEHTGSELAGGMPKTRSLTLSQDRVAL